MKYTKEEVIQFIEEEDVKFIRLSFCDVFGIQKNISIMPGELNRAFTYGIAVDAWSIAGFNSSLRSDLFLHPDPSTLVTLPWRPENGRVVRMFCKITWPDGTLFEADSREILKQAVEEAERAGISFRFGTEQEFYLFCRDEEGNPTRKPYDYAGYMDIAPEDKGENIRREICLMLEQMNIYPESSHHEEGPGQNEIDFRYDEPLIAADNALTFCWVVKTIANRNGLYADFSPKPLKELPGNGMHINFSVRGKNKEDLLPYAMAGILKEIRAMTLFLNPAEESYRRLGMNKAPRFVTWSPENRSQLVRIPAAFGPYKRAELRSPDPFANPYLAFALLIHAGLRGIAKRSELPEATNLNLFTADDSEVSHLEKLPYSRTQAVELAKQSTLVKEVVPSCILDAYFQS